MQCVKDSAETVVDIAKLVELIIKKSSIDEIQAQVSKLLSDIPKILKDCILGGVSSFNKLVTATEPKYGTCEDALKGFGLFQGFKDVAKKILEKIKKFDFKVADLVKLYQALMDIKESCKIKKSRDYSRSCGGGAARRRGASGNRHLQVHPRLADDGRRPGEAGGDDRPERVDGKHLLPGFEDYA